MAWGFQKLAAVRDPLFKSSFITGLVSQPGRVAWTLFRFVKSRVRVVLEYYFFSWSQYDILFGDEPFDLAR